MNDALLTRRIYEYKYEVFHDLDFSSDDLCSQYKQLIKHGGLFPYGVVKYKTCECCCMWSEIHSESLWGIVEDSPESALIDYLLQQGHPYSELIEMGVAK